MTELIIDITYLCNSNCKYCQWSVSNPGVKRKISINQILVPKRNLINLGISKIVLTGGEPLLSTHLKPVIKYYTNFNFPIRLISNAILLNKENISNLMSIGVKEFVISLDSLSYNTYSMNREVSHIDFQKIIKNLERLTEIKEKEDYFLAINVVLTSANSNWENISEILKFAKERGIKQVKFQPVFDDGFLSKKAHNLRLTYKNKNQIEKIREKLIELQLNNEFTNSIGFWTDLIAFYSARKLNPQKCNLADNIVLLHEGTFKFCFWCEHTIYGNIHQKLTKKKVKMIRERFKERLSKCKVNTQCFCLQPIDHEWI